MGSFIQFLDEFMQILYDAVENGYTVAWGTDGARRASRGTE